MTLLAYITAPFLFFLCMNSASAGVEYNYSSPQADSLDSISGKIIIPNVFTPNGDGVNDWFYVPNTGLRELSIKIYNRWGALVWETTAPEIRWDGRTPAGIALPEGTYFYSIKAVTHAETAETSGSLFLLR